MLMTVLLMPRRANSIWRGLEGKCHVLDDPVVEGTMVLKLQGTQGMGDALHGVLKGMGIVVHGIDAPLVPGAVMAGVIDTVDHRITHVEVAGGQIDLGAEGVPAIANSPARIRRNRSRLSSLGRSR